VTHAPHLQRKAAAPVRAAARALQRQAAPVRATLLQRQFGAQGMAALIGRRQIASAESSMQPHARAAHTDTSAPAAASFGDLTVSSPGDASEREAVSVASQVMRIPEGGTQARPAIDGVAGDGVVSRADAPTQPAMNAAARPDALSTAAIQDAMPQGVPLSASVRGFMEPRFGVSFEQVRIHTDQRAASLSAGLHANAFTVGQHIFFAQDAYRPDEPAGRELIAHELTHTLQHDSPAAASAHTQVRREAANGSGSNESEGESFSESLAWEAAEQIAPDLVPIMRKGPAGVMQWLGDIANAAAAKMFDTITAPLKTISGVGRGLAARFAPLIASVQTAVAQIMRNDCTPLRDAAARIEALALSIVTPIVEVLQPVVATIEGVLKSVWDIFGAPVWDWIKRFAAWHWSILQSVAHQAQELVNWIVNSRVVQQVWTWFKNKIGFGDGPEGHDGLIQWVQRKLGEAWDKVSAKLAPFKKEIATAAAIVGGAVLVVSPAGPIAIAGAAVAGAATGLRWIAANWGKNNMIVQARTYLHGTLLPGLLVALHGAQGAVAHATRTLRHAIGSLADMLKRVTGNFGETFAGLAAAALNHIEREGAALSAWADEQLSALAENVSAACMRLRPALTNVLNVLEAVGMIYFDVYLLPVLLAQKAWSLLPSCIRDPIIDFAGPLMLRQIALFQELVRDDVAWQQTKSDVMKIIRLVFTNHDLPGALKATFFLILRIFNLPPELLVTVTNKALAAWDIVSQKPLQFLRNFLRSIGAGFKLLASNFLFHLKFGLKEWLLGPLKEQKIVPPADWSDPKAVFFFVLNVLGLSADHVFTLLKRANFDETKIEKLRIYYGRISSAVAWIRNSIDTSKSPAENARGIVAQAGSLGLQILQGMANWVALRVATELAAEATAAAASAGLAEVLRIAQRFYRALVTASRWARRIVEMVNSTLDNVLDIANGAIDKVGAKLEDVMHRGMPVVIGFLADQVGLGGVGEAIRGVIDDLRTAVDNALLWLIEKIRAGLEALINLVKAGVAKLVDWWRARFGFHGKDGSAHETYLEGGPESAVLMIASAQPEPLKGYLKRLADDPSTAAGAAAAMTEYVNVMVVVGKLQKVIGNDPGAESARRALVNDLAVAFDALNNVLATFVVAGKPYALPEKAVWKKREEVGTKFSTVEKLSTKTSEIQSDTPTGEPSGWELLSVRGMTNNRETGHDWKRMHMITAKIGGSGEKDNLVPARTIVNSGSAVRGFEDFVQRLVQSQSKKGSAKGPAQNNVVWIDVRASGYYNAVPGLYKDKMFVSNLVMKAGLMLWEKSDWTRMPAAHTVSVSIERPDFSGGLPNFNTLGLTALINHFKLSERFIREYVMTAHAQHGDFKNYAEVIDAIEDVQRKRSERKTKEFLANIGAVEQKARDYVTKPEVRFE
jgi:hypothetical protein